MAPAQAPLLVPAAATVVAVQTDCTTAVTNTHAINAIEKVFVKSWEAFLKQEKNQKTAQVDHSRRKH